MRCPAATEIPSLVTCIFLGIQLAWQSHKQIFIRPEWKRVSFTDTHRHYSFVALRCFQVNARDLETLSQMPTRSCTGYFHAFIKSLDSNGTVGHTSNGKTLGSRGQSYLVFLAEAKGSLGLNLAQSIASHVTWPLCSSLWT